MKIPIFDTSIKQERLYCLDWLKVFAILMVFVLHNAHFFDFIDWNIKNSTESSGMMLILLLIHFWCMPIFFLLAGAGTKFALEHRTGKQYIGERIKRLIIPLGIGMMLLAPPQGYVENLSKLKFEGSFIDYYPCFFKNLPHTFNLEVFGANTYHLWFLGFLFAFSIIALPLFVWLKTTIAQKFISKIASFCDKKGVIFLFALPILISHLVLRVSFPDYNDWADFLYWFIYFVYGYLIFSHIKFEQAIKRHCKAALIIAIVCILSIVAMLLGGFGIDGIAYPTYSVQSIIFMTIYSFLTWSWVIFMLSTGFKLLNFNNKFLEYSSEAVLPFYLLHQTIILIIGFYVVQWDASIIEKFLFIGSTSLIATIGIYDLFIRRINFSRFLFGMKSLKKQKKLPRLPLNNLG